MVPIVDLRCRIGQGKTEATALRIVIVVQVQARLARLLADGVLDILSFEPIRV
ncbi:MAG TPA: chemotaxis protein CheW [Xanthobacteraceae bacterium]|jgi:purine-binding chemotaxis protein CheW